jgi:hypothetical protein
MSAPLVSITNVPFVSPGCSVHDVLLATTLELGMTNDTAGLLLFIVHPVGRPLDGSSSVIDPPCNIQPDVVNDSVAVEVTPGVSTVDSHCNEPPSTPAVMRFIAICVGPSVSTPTESRTVTVAFNSSRSDDGVRTPSITNDSDSDSGTVSPCVVSVSVREADTQVLVANTRDVPIVLSPLSTIVGLSLVIDQPPANGSTTVIVLKGSSKLVVCKDNVDADVTPGVSTVESQNDVPICAPAVTASTTTFVGPSVNSPSAL